MNQEYYYEFNFNALVDKAKYFQFYKYNSNSKQGAIISFPGIITMSCCVKFLEIVQQEEEIVMSLLPFMSIKSIFILADYFGVDYIFHEIQLRYYDNFQLGPSFLKYFIDFYSFKHPATIQFYINFISVFPIPHGILQSPDFINLITSTNKFKRHIRNARRRETFYSTLVRIKCELCQEAIIYTQKPSSQVPVMAPCCGSPLHGPCVRRLLVVHNNVNRCCLCGTKIYNRLPYTARETRHVTSERQLRRQKFCIPIYARLPPLPMFG